MTKNDNDLRLMRGVAAGDERAMADLVQRWQGPVLAYICRFLGCQREEARDIAQEAFLSVWKSGRRFRATALFSTWLFAIVTNLCRNHLRTTSRRPVLVAIDDEDGVVNEYSTGSGNDPHALAEASEMAGRIDGALAELPENQRAALLLKRVEGLSYREISVILEVSESAVESLLVRARRALAKKFLSPPQENGKTGVLLGEDE